MPTVDELTAGYGNFMLSPRRGPGVCRRCFNLTDGYSQCYACSHCESWLDAVAPISYSVAHEQLHHALACYKRLSGAAARKVRLELAAVLWRHLAAHEHCVAAGSGSGEFQIVTTVPAGTPERDAGQPLRHIVEELVQPVRNRYQRLLERSDTPVQPRAFDARRFTARTRLTGEAVLLIDDTWTTGASAQSAAAALKQAGAGPVATVVIGRHLNREWRENNRRLRALRAPFDWGRCPHCEPKGRMTGPGGDGAAPANPRCLQPDARTP